MKLNNKKTDLNRHFIKNDIQIANKHIKRWSPSSVRKQLKTETTMRYYTYHFEWLTSLILIIPITGKGQQELSFSVEGNTKWCRNFRIQFSSLFQAKKSFIIQFSNCTPRYLTNWFKILCPHKNLHVNVCNSFTHNCQRLEATKMSFDRWRDR